MIFVCFYCFYFGVCDFSKQSLYDISNDFGNKSFESVLVKIYKK